jgi:drug/metabolite transporter (DMT)-like permease
MRLQDLLRLITLAALWGGSFLLIRISAPELGPASTAVFRLLLGGGLIALYQLHRREPLSLSQNWRPYLQVGLLNSGLPFLCFGYAALTLPASYLIILSACSPFIAAGLSAVFLHERLRPRQVLGLGLALTGVAVVAGFGPVPIGAGEMLAIAAGLAGASCYATATLLIRGAAVRGSPNAQAAMSQFTAGILLAPLCAIFPPSGPVSAVAWVSAVALGVLCSGIAYVLYFRLVLDVGPSRALSVTFLTPPFGIAWSYIALGEAVTGKIVIGTLLVIAGTALLLTAPRARSPGTETAHG